MAIPGYISSSTGSTDAAGAWSHTGIASVLNRVVILQVLQDGSTSGTVTLGTVTNMKNLAGTNNTMTYIGEFQVGETNLARQYLWIGRSTSTTASVANGTNGTSEDVYVMMHYFDDVSTGTTLDTVIENVTAGSTTTSNGTSATAADASITTLGPDRLALNFLAINDDNPFAGFTGQSGGTWTTRASYAEASGTDGAIYLIDGRPVVNFNQETDNSSQPIGGGANVVIRAQSFTPTSSGTINAISIKLALAGSPTDGLVLTLETNDATGGDHPSGTVIETGTVVSPAVGWNEFTFATAANVTASTKYWITVARTGALNSNTWDWRRADSDVISGEVAMYYPGPGAPAWISDTNNDFTFRAPVYTAGTIDGGTGSITDSDAWGVVGFALIGTTASATSTNAFAQAQASIKGTYNVFAQANADIKQTYNRPAQAQADIKQTYNGFAQANAQIVVTSRGFAQAQANIEATINSFAQAQANILQTYNGFAQSQADILQTYRGYGQAQTTITQTYNTFAQAQANILQTYNSFAQAQAKINSFDVEAFAQAQAFILNALAVHGQAQADILQIYNSFAQAQANILQTYQGYAQAQANVLQTYQAYANAQAKIIQTYNAFAQAQAAILAVSNSYAQAQADILQTYNVFAQAQASILQVYQSYAQAQAAILTTYQSYAQAQADILQVYQGYAQAQATILQAYQSYGQAQATILATYNAFAQAQASIKTTYQSYGQALALIYIAQYLRPIADITTNAWERVVI